MDLHENSDTSGLLERRMSRRTRPRKRPIDECGAAEEIKPQAKRPKPTNRMQYESDVRSHLTSYSLVRNMYSELLASVPHFGRGETEPAYLQAVKDINDVQGLIDKFARKLEKKVSSMETSCRQLERIGHASSQWWDHVDIFSPTIPERYLDDLDEHPPEVASQWSRHLEYRMNPVMRIVRPHTYNGQILNYLRTPFWNQNTFFPRVLREISRLGTMVGGEVEAIRLFLRVKLNYLHCNLDYGNTAYIFLRDDDHVEMHDKLDEVLRQVLEPIRCHPLNIYVRNRRLDPLWINAASHCREILQFPQTSGYRACEHEGNGDAASLSGCFQKNMAIALDMLQRHACTEVKINVYRAVGKRLPRELTDHVFACALQAEEIPHDPRTVKGREANIICSKHEQIASRRIPRARIR